MASEHTPGPWMVSGTTVYALNDGGSNIFSAHVEPGYAIEAHRKRVRLTLNEAEANARLIAAAPDLLEALNRLADAADDSDGSHYGTLSTSFVRDIARAAIAKAMPPTAAARAAASRARSSRIQEGR